MGMKARNTGITSSFIGKKAIIRCTKAGVHYGEVVAIEGEAVRLKNSRRLWYWVCKSGHTLSGVARNGLSDASKISGTLESILLLDACEIIPVTKDAALSIETMGAHRE